MATLSKNQLAALQALYQKEQEAPTCKLPAHIEWQRGNVHYFDVFGYGKFTRATNNALIQKGMIEEYAFGKDDVAQFIRLTPAGKAALGISDEPQPAVAVETPVAQDSDYQPMVGDDVSIKYTTDNYHGIVRGVTSDSISIVRYNQTILSFLLSDVIVTLVSRPTSTSVAISDDGAVDNTPSEQQSNDGQPSGSDEYTPAKDDVVEVIDTERIAYGIYTVASVDDNGDYAPHVYLTSRFDSTIVEIAYPHELRKVGEWVENPYGLDILQHTGGWLADALQTVNVEREAAANDDYLPPTVEDNDDLPFSDLGEDETTANENQYDSLLATLVKFAVMGKVAVEREMALRIIRDTADCWNLSTVEREIEELESIPDADSQVIDAYIVLADIRKGALA